MTYDIIAVSAHPDDIEVAMGGSGSLPKTVHFSQFLLPINERGIMFLPVIRNIS